MHATYVAAALKFLLGAFDVLIEELSGTGRIASSEEGCAKGGRSNNVARLGIQCSLVTLNGSVSVAMFLEDLGGSNPQIGRTFGRFGLFRE